VTQDVKDKLLDWIFAQGVSTVLLCGILTYLAYAIQFLVPAHFEAIEKGYGRNAEITARALESIASSHDRDRQMFIELLSGRTVTNKP
jgi:hypothetical protein